jgi:hypothetical protein
MKFVKVYHWMERVLYRKTVVYEIIVHAFAESFGNRFIWHDRKCQYIYGKIKTIADDKAILHYLLKLPANDKLKHTNLISR